MVDGGTPAAEFLLVCVLRLGSISSCQQFIATSYIQKCRVIHQTDTIGAKVTSDRLASLEVRSFKMDRVCALWHLEFHHGSRKILYKKGEWTKTFAALHHG